MRSMPKDPPYRNQKLRDLAKECPNCMLCGNPNDGTIVGCHSNSLHDGKGVGTKSHDVLAYLCRSCHDQVDGRVTGFDPIHRSELFYFGVYNSVVWLLKEGHLVVK